MTRWWAHSQTHELFDAKEAMKIFNMAISPRVQQDRMVWRETKNKVFSIRSAYYLAKYLEERGKESCSNEKETTTLWKVVWKVRVSPVIKVFLWKAYRNILATKENLQKRNIVDDPLCLIYGLEAESVGHILWWCGSAQDVWLESSRKIQKTLSRVEVFINIFAEMIGKLDP